MIASIRGKLLESSPLSVVIEAAGLGYAVSIPITTAEKIGSVGSECFLYTMSVYREDSATLYGFAAKEDRDFFKLIVEKVSGIGPKIAISMLSRLSTELLSSAIASSDVALLAKCPGIGKKTAERLVIELKDKVGVPASGSQSSFDSSELATFQTSPSQDAIAGLMSLGYKPAEADRLVRKATAVAGEDADAETLIKTALSS